MTRTSQFDSVADHYPEYPHGLAVRDFMERPALRGAVGDVTGLAVLDLGCGAGYYAQYLAKWGAAHVVGVDASAGLLELARAGEATEPLGISYRLADAATDHLPDLAGRFDLVLSGYALPYADTPAALTGMFTTVRTVLRPGGRFVAATLNPDYADESAHPGHYERYNMWLTARQYPPVDGTPLNFRAAFGETSAPSLDVTAYWWSRAAYERAARATGFGPVSWRHYTVADEGVERYGEDLWHNYVQRPHAVILEAGLPTT